MTDDSVASEPNYGRTPEEDLTGWRRVLAAPLLFLVRFYRKWISPAMPATCRFYPTCSTYGLTAILRFGPLKGTGLTVRRIARCHPWNPGGVDHVPSKVTPGATSDAHSATPAHIIAKDD